ncbi:MAG: hypothetical protein GQ540_03310 [Lutibacter sp.]|uniref:hypothetical protein n=1 Tax=Lutibacter sp. TaxID=1925666 RepID=UPI001A08D5FD|nr:hypothetical protein [Lutibacter sp.]NOR27540.1 hypothetical protein [Lutibacter sp.]
MSIKYKIGKDVPSEVLTSRLDELSSAITKGKVGIEREFYMRVPAEVDHDADLVIAEASRRIAELENELSKYRKKIKYNLKGFELTEPYNTDCFYWQLAKGIGYFCNNKLTKGTDCSKVNCAFEIEKLKE